MGDLLGNQFFPDTRLGTGFDPPSATAVRVMANGAALVPFGLCFRGDEAPSLTATEHASMEERLEAGLLGLTPAGHGLLAVVKELLTD